MTKTEKRIEFFKRYSKFYLLAASEGIRLLPYYFHRTDEQQAELYRQGKSNRDGTNKRSYHQDWLAVDAVIVNDDDSLEWNGDDPRYKRLSEIAGFVDLEAGFWWSSKDSNHTQWKEVLSK